MQRRHGMRNTIMARGGGGILAALGLMFSAASLQAQGYLPPQLAGQKFKNYYDIDFGNAHIIWLCSNGQFALRNGVSMSNDRNPGQGQSDEIGRWTVLSQLGSHFIQLTYANGEQDVHQIDLDGEGNVVVDNGRKWYHTGNAGC